MESGNHSVSQSLITYFKKIRSYKDDTGVKVLTPNPKDLSSIPEASWWKERTDTHKLSSGYHIGTVAHMQIYVHSTNMRLKIKSLFMDHFYQL